MSYSIFDITVTKLIGSRLFFILKVASDNICKKQRTQVAWLAKRRSGAVYFKLYETGQAFSTFTNEQSICLLKHTRVEGPVCWNSTQTHLKPLARAIPLRMSCWENELSGSPSRSVKFGQDCVHGEDSRASVWAQWSGGSLVVMLNLAGDGCDR